MLMSFSNQAGLFFKNETYFKIEFLATTYLIEFSTRKSLSSILKIQLLHPRCVSVKWNGTKVAMKHLQKLVSLAIIFHFDVFMFRNEKSTILV